MPGYDEFIDPNSAIARILQQMQGAADRSNPNLPPGGAQPVGVGPGMPETMGPGPQQGALSPEDLIAQLLQQQR
jgi:hypothetical protein